MSTVTQPGIHQCINYHPIANADLFHTLRVPSQSQSVSQSARLARLVSRPAFCGSRSSRGFFPKSPDPTIPAPPAVTAARLFPTVIPRNPLATAYVSVVQLRADDQQERDGQGYYYYRWGYFRSLFSKAKMMEVVGFQKNMQHAILASASWPPRILPAAAGFSFPTSLKLRNAQAGIKVLTCWFVEFHQPTACH